MTWLIGIIILVLLQISRCVDWCPCVSYLNYRLTAERNNNSDIKSTADGSMQGINNSQIINDGQINLSQGPNEESIVLCMINIGQTGDGFKGTKILSLYNLLHTNEAVEALYLQI